MCMHSFLPLFSFCVLTLLGFQVIECCPRGYIQHGAYCYYFCNIRASWAQATQYCEIFGGTLAVIDSETEQLYIESYMNNTWNNHNQTKNIWIGGTDLLVENEWNWVKPLKPIEYTRWAPGEPNHQWRGQSEDCLSINADTHFRWNDQACENESNFICQVE